MLVSFSINKNPEIFLQRDSYIFFFNHLEMNDSSGNDCINRGMVLTSRDTSVTREALPVSPSFSLGDQRN